jgi:sugar lactone lactonase YvrE
MRRDVRAAAIPIVTMGLVMGSVTPLHAAASPASQAVRAGAGQGQRAVFPATIALPAGFRPEGIAIGPGPVAYLGSLANGSIFRVDLRTGRSAVVSQGPGTPTVGVKTDRHGRLYAAGGAAGDARVIDTRSGRVLAAYQLESGTSFINDVVLTPSAAWFTDSANPALHRLPLSRDGRPAAATERIPLTGDIVYGPGNNANGIAPTPDGRGLLIVQSNTGLLFRVDPSTGVTRGVDLGGETLVNGDGLLQRGRTLYVVQNRLNTVAVLRLNATGTAAEIVARLTDPRFDVPTTVAAFDGRLYLPNARFTTTPTPTTTYDLVAIRRGSGG